MAFLGLLGLASAWKTESGLRPHSREACFYGEYSQEHIFIYHMGYWSEKNEYSPTVDMSDYPFYMETDNFYKYDNCDEDDLSSCTLSGAEMLDMCNYATYLNTMEYDDYYSSDGVILWSLNEAMHCHLYDPGTEPAFCDMDEGMLTYDDDDRRRRLFENSMRRRPGGDSGSNSRESGSSEQEDGQESSGGQTEDWTGDETAAEDYSALTDNDDDGGNNKCGVKWQIRGAAAWWETCENAYGCGLLGADETQITLGFTGEPQVKYVPVGAEVTLTTDNGNVHEFPTIYDADACWDVDFSDFVHMATDTVKLFFRDSGYRFFVRDQDCNDMLIVATTGCVEYETLIITFDDEEGADPGFPENTMDGVYDVVNGCGFANASIVPEELPQHILPNLLGSGDTYLTHSFRIFLDPITSERPVLDATWKTCHTDKETLEEAFADDGLVIDDVDVYYPQTQLQKHRRLSILAIVMLSLVACAGCAGMFVVLKCWQQKSRRPTDPLSRADQFVEAAEALHNATGIHIATLPPTEMDDPDGHKLQTWKHSTTRALDEFANRIVLLTDKLKTTIRDPNDQTAGGSTRGHSRVGSHTSAASSRYPALGQQTKRYGSTSSRGSRRRGEQTNRRADGWAPYQRERDSSPSYEGSLKGGRKRSTRRSNGSQRSGRHSRQHRSRDYERHGSSASESDSLPIRGKTRLRDSDSQKSRSVKTSPVQKGKRRTGQRDRIAGMLADGRSGAIHVEYRVVNKLRSGNGDSLHLCKRRADDAKFLAKLIDKPLKPEDAARLEVEIGVMARLQHPCLLQIKDVYENSFRLYIIMDNVERDLGDVLIERGFSIPEQEAKHLIFKIIDAIQYLAESNVNHMQLYAENIWIGERLTDVRLSNYGPAKYTGPHRKLKVIKTTCYTAPEVLRKQGGSGQNRLASTIWQMGCIMHLLLLGHFPFDSDSTEEIEKQILRTKLKPRKWTKISRDAQDLIVKMLNKNPQTRIRPAEALRHPWFRGISWQRPPIPSNQVLKIPEELLSKCRLYELQDAVPQRSVHATSFEL